MRRAALYAASGGLLTLAFGALGAQEAEAAPKSKPSTARQAVPKAKPKPAAKLKPAAKSKAAAKSKPAAKPKAVAKTKPATKSVAKPKPKPAAKSTVKPKPQAQKTKPAPKPNAAKQNPASKPNAAKPKPAAKSTTTPKPPLKAAPKPNVVPKPPPPRPSQNPAPKPRVASKPTTSTKPKPLPAKQEQARRQAADDLARTAAGRQAYAESQRPSGQKSTAKPKPLTATPAGARQNQPRQQAANDLRRTAAARTAYAESQRASGQKPSTKPAPVMRSAAVRAPQPAKQDQARRQAAEDLARTAAGRQAYAESQRPSGQKPTPKAAPKPAPKPLSQSLRLAEAAAETQALTERQMRAKRQAAEDWARTAPGRAAYAESQRGGAPGTAAKRAAQQRAAEDLARTAAGRQAYAESQRPSGQKKPTIKPAPGPKPLSQSLRLAEAAAETQALTERQMRAKRQAAEDWARTAPGRAAYAESQRGGAPGTAAKRAAQQRAAEDLARTAAGRQAYAESQRGGAPGTAAKRAAREEQLRIAQGMVDYHDAIQGKPVGQRDAQVVEKVDDQHTRVTNARTGQSAVHNMPLSGYVHPPKTVETEVTTVTNNEIIKTKKPVTVNEWRKPSDPRYANVSIGQTSEGLPVAVSQGPLPKEIEHKLSQSRLQRPEEAKSTADGRRVTVFPRKEQFERNFDDLERQWGQSVKNGKVQLGQVGEAIAGTAALAADGTVGLGLSNTYGTGKDCLGSGKNCGDMAVEAGLAVVSATPLKGAGAIKPLVSGVARSGDDALRAARGIDEALGASDEIAQAGRAARNGRTTEAPRRTAPREDPQRTPESPRTAPRENPQRTSPQQPSRVSPDKPVNPGFRQAPTAAALGLAATGVTAIPDAPDRPETPWRPSDSPEHSAPDGPRKPAAEPDREAPTTGDHEPRFDDPANPSSLPDPEGPESPRRAPGGDNPITPERPRQGPSTPEKPENPPAYRSSNNSTAGDNNAPEPANAERPQAEADAPREPAPDRAAGEKPGAAASSPSAGDGTSTPKWSSDDPLVGDLANAIDDESPGMVTGVNVPAYRPNGTLATDFDIETTNAVIQVKAGSGRGALTQANNTRAVTGKPVIIYGPNLGWKMRQNLTDAGFEVVTSKEQLLGILKGKEDDGVE
ncbi:hypothetical protein G7043_40320 [Lentzea sp. NEAU-D13]|uniref:Uncharacterized protein n=1 Tax=Lentzea alba TaxID=2714351 RepID=A0A7C9RXA2_9PSEU|nr:hypothetical protein [Lentzea alba]NGY65169.1 hypothetical protein [Lentzea alba]